MTYFVIMNTETEQLYRKPDHYSPASYKTLQGAKTACTKLRSKLNMSGRNAPYVVMSNEEFETKHDSMVAVYNRISGDGKTPIYIRRSEVGGCCDPSTELYHTM